MILGSRELLSRNFVKQSGEQGTHGAPLDLHRYGLRREIVRAMPTGGIRCTWTVWDIKESKCGFKAQNKFLR
jgi:hypothetical protein